MIIFFWTCMVFANGIYAVDAYKDESYKSAMLSSFVCGWSVVFLMYALF